MRLRVGVAQKTPASDSHLRSLLKGLSWRAIGTVTTTAIAALIVGDLAIAAQIGCIEAIGKVAVYYIHERVWIRIPFGKGRNE